MSYEGYQRPRTSSPLKSQTDTVVTQLLPQCCQAVDHFHVHTKAIYFQTMSKQHPQERRSEVGSYVPCKESCHSIFCKHSQGSMSLPVHHIAPLVQPPQPSQLAKALAIPVTLPALSTPALAHVSLQVFLLLTPLALYCIVRVSVSIPTPVDRKNERSHCLNFCDLKAQFLWSLLIYPWADDAI